MKHKGRSPQQSSLATQIQQQLNLYTLAAGAAGFAILAAASPAAAEIVYTPANQLIPTNHTLPLDLNRDGIADFIVSNHAFCTTDICGRTLKITPTRALDKIEGMKSIFILKFASALRRGAKIGPSAIFSGKLMAVSGTEYGSGGQWMNASDRYLGLQFSIGSSLHYGWARMSVLANGQGKIKAQLTGYAYETVPNHPIFAGQTGTGPGVEQTGESNAAISLPVPTKTAATVGLLAMGSPALTLWRRDELDRPYLSS